MDTGAAHLTDLAGPFFGNGFEHAQLERILLKHYDPKWIALEPELVSKTWFDYRHAHPVMRAYFFQHSYTLAWRRAYRRFYDHAAQVDNKHPWSVRDLFMHKSGADGGRSQVVIKTMSTMRAVDELGVPYDVFFDAAIEHFMQKRQYSTVWRKAMSKAGVVAPKLPPVRVLRDGEALIAAQERFDRMNAKRIVAARHPAYRADAYEKSPWQVEHQTYLCREAKRRGAGCARVVAHLISERKVLTEIVAARVLGIDMVRAARQFYA